MNASEYPPPYIDDDPQPTPPFRERKEENPYFEGESEFITDLEVRALQNPGWIRELSESAEQQLRDYELEYGELPVAVRPLYLLHQLNDEVEQQIAEDADRVAESQVRGRGRIDQLIREERRTEMNSHIPTIGIEIEIPFEPNPAQKELFQATLQFGIPKDRDYEGAWEFSVPYSHSAHVQAAIVRELIRGGFIQTTSDQKQIAGEGDFALHVNLGVPENLRVSADVAHEDATSEGESRAFSDSIHWLTNALTYAFSSSERLRKGKYNKSVQVVKGANSVEGTTERVEIRSLEVRDKTVYRMLEEIQMLGAGLFAAYKENPDDADHALAAIWNAFEEEVQQLFNEKETDDHALEENVLVAIRALEKTDIQKRLRALITAAALKLYAVREQEEASREVETLAEESE